MTVIMVATLMSAGTAGPRPAAPQSHPASGVGSAPAQAQPASNILSWDTFLGGPVDDVGNGIALDPAGNIYVVGNSKATWGSPLRPYSGGVSDAFVAKLSGNGSLLWNTFLGSASSDYGYGLGLSAGGDVYVSGRSGAAWGAPLRPYSGAGDVFVAKLDSSGALQWNTFLGGTAAENGGELAVSSSGEVVVTGASSASWGSPVNPFSGGPGFDDAFVAKLTGGGALQWSTFLGGAQNDAGYALACDAAGDVFVSGSSESGWGAPRRAFSGQSDGFVAKLGGSGGSLQWNTFLGQPAWDDAYGLALDSAGHVYAAGYSDAAWGTPINVGGGAYDIYVAKLDSGGGLLWNTFLGGAGDDSADELAVARDGAVYLTGSSAGTWGSPDTPFQGSADAFAARLSAAGALRWNTFGGGAGDDHGSALAIDNNRNIYLTGVGASSWGSPIRPYAGAKEAFVSKITITSEILTRHAIGDFDGDAQDEAAVDFGGLGVWMYNAGSWSQLSGGEVEELAALDIDGNGDDEIVADSGEGGLLLWDGGSVTQLSAINVEGLAVGDLDGSGDEEVLADLGAGGLAISDLAQWTQLSAVNPDFMTFAQLNGTGGREIVADFGAIGLWVRQGTAWFQASGVNADFFACGDTDGNGTAEIVGDFGATGLWLWNAGSWTQLSGVNVNYLITADLNADGRAEILGDFGTVGLWLYDAGAWTMLSGMREDFMIAANLDAEPGLEAVVDFGPVGLWLYDAGAWTQLSGVNADYLISGDFDGDAQAELMVDFGALGLWVCDSGAWTQVSGANPE